MSINHKLIADETLHILEQGFYINVKNEKIEISNLVQHAKSNTRLYTPGELEQLRKSILAKEKFNTQFSVTNETTLDAARRIAGSNDLLALNFASAKNPGGGFLRGTVAQEESIARASGLYPCLLTAPQYYEFHRSAGSPLYSDHMIYSPRVPVFKYEDGSLMDQPIQVSIITSAAVNVTDLDRKDSSKMNMVEPIMRTRIEKMLALCYEHNHRNLLLGAWGCGVFGNDPEMIAGLFREAFDNKFSGCFQNVLFAIKTSSEEML
jgi:uncharacterized protein (TIGR02452 family)